METAILDQEYSWKNSLPLSNYSTGSKAKVWWNCSKCSFEWETRIQHRYNGSSCPSCVAKIKQMERTKSKNPITITHPEIAKEWNDSTNINYITFGMNKNFHWKCNICSASFSDSPNSRCNRNTGCPYCSGRRLSDQNRLSVINPKLTQELFNRSLGEKLHCNSTQKVDWKCTNCDHVWASTVNNRFKGRGCPKCAWKNSIPQRIIEGWLTDNNFDYQNEFKIDECRNIKPLPFDFAIFKNNNLYCLIEYQGQQHYRPIWGVENLKKIRIRDSIKWNYCVEKNIRLLTISYWNFEEICDILTSELKDK